MPTQMTILTAGLGGLGESFATVQDLDNISLPRGGAQATINSKIFPSPPYNLMGLNLQFQITEDGIVNIPQTFTFPSNYSTLDQVVAAIAISNVIASNNSGRFRLQTVKYGYEQGIHLSRLGTANAILGFDTLEDTDERGVNSLTKEFTEDDKAYQLVVATSIASGYLRRRYLFPLTSWGFDLVEKVCDIAAFKLMFREGYSPADKSYDGNFKRRYDTAMEWLSEVGNRKIHPFIVAGHKPVPNAGIGVRDPRGWGWAMGVDCSRWGGCGC